MRADAVTITTPEMRGLDVAETIENLLASGHYDWARETLEGIHAHIARTGACSIAMEEAVTHIIIGRLKHDHS